MKIKIKLSKLEKKTLKELSMEFGLSKQKTLEKLIVERAEK